MKQWTIKESKHVVTICEYHQNYQVAAKYYNVSIDTIRGVYRRSMNKSLFTRDYDPQISRIQRLREMGKSWIEVGDHLDIGSEAARSRLRRYMNSIKSEPEPMLMAS